MVKRSSQKGSHRTGFSDQPELHSLSVRTYRALVDGLPVSVLYFDQDRHVRFQNKACEERLGRSLADVEGRHLRDVLGEDPYERIRTFLDSALAGTPTTFEGSLYSASGDPRWLTARFIPDAGRDGQVHGAFFLADDRAWQTMARQSLVFENMNDAVIISDLNGRITDWNPAATRVFGYEREEMLGRTVGRLYDLNEQDGLRLQAEVIAEMARADRWAGELRFIRKDDSRGICETVVVPLRDHTGKRIATVGVNRDVTEKKKIEAELARNHAILEAVADTTTDAIFVKDLDGRYIMMNHYGAHLLGRPPEELVGKNDTDLFAPEEAARIMRLDRQVMDTGDASTLDEEVTILGDQTRWLTSKAPWRDAVGNVIGLIGIARNVTERWRAQELARQRQTELAHVLRIKTLGEMAAGLAHELNQPLAAVANYARGCVRRVKDRAATADDLLPAMEEMAAQAMRAGNIVRRLHGLVRRQPTRQETFDVTDLIRGTAQLAEPDLRRASVALQLRLGPPLYVQGDSVQVEQILLSLVKNATEAMSEGGSLVIEAALSEDKTVEIVVSDTGPGLTEDQLPTIFDPFVTTKPNGLGMGLAISRSIAEAHRGRLYGKNRPNGGATFHLLLPRSEGHSRQAD